MMNSIQRASMVFNHQERLHSSSGAWVLPSFRFLTLHLLLKLKLLYPYLNIHKLDLSASSWIGRRT